jgi:pyruvate formate lyase activating enzyme
VGHLHSYEMGSVVDGPGVRFVLWTTGCLMRCQYCHNPDTWHLKNGRRVTVDELMAEVAKYTRFMEATGGGVTISGGEPLVQAPFVARVLRACKERGLHTTLDTNGSSATGSRTRSWRTWTSSSSTSSRSTPRHTGA